MVKKLLSFNGVGIFRLHGMCQKPVSAFSDLACPAKKGQNSSVCKMYPYKKNTYMSYFLPMLCLLLNITIVG